jgi:LuxR family transcriptional regulator, maltose regulon positive regulatory protein
MVVRPAVARGPTGIPRPLASDDLPVEVLESKLYTPTVRPGVVPRPQLLVRLRGARDVPTVALVAPAGYGRTTLLALWAAADDRPFAWLSVDPQDNDPIILLTHLAVAINRISPLPAGIFDALRSMGTSVPGTVVPRLGSALARLPHEVVLVLDDVHHLRDGPSLDALIALVGHPRATAQIALAGRGVPVPLARQRAQGRALEISADGLAFPADGARALLRAAGADPTDEEVVALVGRTEGWAAGLYLAALAYGDMPTGAGGGSMGRDDRLVTDYLASVRPRSGSPHISAGGRLPWTNCGRSRRPSARPPERPASSERRPGCRSSDGCRKRSREESCPQTTSCSNALSCSPGPGCPTTAP